MSESTESRPLEATGQTIPQSVSSEAEQDWADLDPKERSKRAKEQNKQAREDAQRAIQEDTDRRLEAQRNAIGQVTSTMPSKSFQEAAKDLEATPQPPNPFDVVGGSSAPTAVRPPENPENPDATAATSGTPEAETEAAQASTAGEGVPVNPSPPAPGSTTTP